MSETQITPIPSSLLIEMVREMRDSVNKLAEKVDDVNKRVVYMEGADLQKSLNDIAKKIDKIEEQVQRIDKNQAVIFGIAGFVGAIAGFFSAFIKGVFGGG